MRINPIFCGVVSLAMLLLTGCVSMQPATEKAANETRVTFATRVSKLQQLTHFELAGAMAVRRGEQADSASYTWQQYGRSAFNIYLSGPMGAGGTQLRGTLGEVILRDSKGEQFKAATAEDLLQQRMGWTVPVSQLFYWVRGIPESTTATKTLDKYQHLKTLEEAGWQLVYERYTNVQGIDLPSKITLTRDKIRVRLVVRKWQLKTPA